MCLAGAVRASLVSYTNILSLKLMNLVSHLGKTPLFHIFQVLVFNLCDEQRGNASTKNIPVVQTGEN